MTPTLLGRLQTRLFLLATIGSLWTLLIGPLLPRPGKVTLTDQYTALFTAILLVAACGLVWEILYHLLQQFRWEKDWPTLFGLVVGLPEGLVVWALLRRRLPWDVGAIPASTFLLMFTTTWLVVWAVANGPMQVFFVRWRYKGGRLNPKW